MRLQWLTPSHNLARPGTESIMLRAIRSDATEIKRHKRRDALLRRMKPTNLYQHEHTLILPSFASICIAWSISQNQLNDFAFPFLPSLTRYFNLRNGERKGRPSVCIWIWFTEVKGGIWKPRLPRQIGFLSSQNFRYTAIHTVYQI